MLPRTVSHNIRQDILTVSMFILSADQWNDAITNTDPDLFLKPPLTPIVKMSTTELSHLKHFQEAYQSGFHCL